MAISSLRHRDGGGGRKKGEVRWNCRRSGSWLRAKRSRSWLQSLVSTFASRVRNSQLGVIPQEMPVTPPASKRLSSLDGVSSFDGLVCRKVAKVGCTICERESGRGCSRLLSCPLALSDFDFGRSAARASLFCDGKLRQSKEPGPGTPSGLGA